MALFVKNYIVRGDSLANANEDLMKKFRYSAPDWDNDFNGNNGEDYFTYLDAIKEIIKDPNWNKKDYLDNVKKYFATLEHDSFYDEIEYCEEELADNKILISVIFHHSN